MKNLILVESPTKAKTLTRFLGGKYDIQASYGHIRDLPKGDFGIDLEKNFQPKYVIPQDKRKVIENLKDRVRNVKQIILATDPDREGEAIAFHLEEVLKKEAEKDAIFKRIVFHEITPRAINEALEKPKTIDSNLVSAQTARRVLDRIVGYKLSPILWKKIKRKLSAGRVQSIALRFIVEREREIEKFKGKEFYRIFAVLSKEKEDTPIEFELVKIDGNSVEKQEKITLYDGDYNVSYTLFSKKEAEDLVKEISNKEFKITDLVQKETKRSPLPPFTTSTLQQEASRRFGYVSKRTMSVAQRLYEEGFITYHRTDSFNLSNDFISESRNFIEKTYGKNFLSPSPRIFKTKSKLAQEAHEAIRPTNVFEQKEEVSQKLGRDFAKLYDLIYKRAVSTQMAEAIFLSTRVETEVKNEKSFLFQANGNVLKFPGFLKLWYLSDESEKTLPDLAINEKLKALEINPTSHQTNPPPRYNEASIIAALERHGIGRPSTYAPIISTITARFYVEKTDGRFVPTAIGTAVNDFLVKNFSEIDDIPFTANMEDKLDEIAEGKIDWVPIIKEFYTPFEKTLKKAENEDKVEVAEEKTGRICPKDGGEIIVRHGRFGKFFACANFPNCDYKESIIEDSGYLCPQDQGKMIIKRTRKGKTFFGCGNYPKCTFAVWTKTELEKQAVKTEQAPEPQVNQA